MLELMLQYMNMKGNKMNWLKGLLESKRVIVCMFGCFIIIVLVLIDKPESYHGILAVASIVSIYISGRTITGLKKASENG